MKLPGSIKKNLEQTTQSFFPECLNPGGKITFKGGRSVTPTFAS
jgi:hypothetical protein